MDWTADREPNGVLERTQSSEIWFDEQSGSVSKSDWRLNLGDVVISCVVYIGLQRHSGTYSVSDCFAMD